MEDILVSFGDPGGTFSDLFGWIFQGYPGGAQVERIHPVEGLRTPGGGLVTD